MKPLTVRVRKCECRENAVILFKYHRSVFESLKVSQPFNRTVRFAGLL